MKINTKFKINEEVYVIKKSKDDAVVIFKDFITEILIASHDEVRYYLDDYMDFNEDELISVDRKDLLLEKIDSLLREEI